MDPRQSYSPVADEDLKFRHKHQVLLQKYFVLQKALVSRKRKLRESKEKKQTLMDQVRFLRRRRTFLLKNQSHKFDDEQELAPSHPDVVEYNAGAKGSFCSGNEGATIKGSSLPAAAQPMWTLELEDKAKNKEVVALEPSLRRGKKNKNLPPNGKRVEKRKISWQDQLVVKA